MAKKRKKRFFRLLHLPVGVIFLLIFTIYLIISFLNSRIKPTITSYDVTKGKSAVTNDPFTGIALRTENIAYADTSGYINYYVREGSRVSATTKLYTMDESGNVSTALEELAQESSQLSEENIASIRNRISGFTENYSDDNYQEVYDFKYDLESMILEFFNANSLDAINEKLKESGLDSNFQIKTPNSSGIVLYSIDNMESLTKEQVMKSSFDTSKYTKASLATNSYVESGRPIYKTISSENWEIVIPLTKEQKEKYKETTYVKIRFAKDGFETTGAFAIQENADGAYGVISLSDNMTRYCNQRFIGIEIIAEAITGLKVPKSSVVNHKSYCVPKRYVSIGDDGSYNVLKRTFNKKGEEKIKKLEVEVLSATLESDDQADHDLDNDFFYISTDSLSKGDNLKLTDSQEFFTVEETLTLKGVYNINSGYAKFRTVTILTESNDYYIVQSDSVYGLQVYDKIVLNGSTVKNNQIIFN